MTCPASETAPVVIRICIREVGKTTGITGIGTCSAASISDTRFCNRTSEGIGMTCSAPDTAPFIGSCCICPICPCTGATSIDRRTAASVYSGKYTASTIPSIGAVAIKLTHARSIGCAVLLCEIVAWGFITGPDSGMSWC